MFGLHVVFVQKQMKPYQSRTTALQPTYKYKKKRKKLGMKNAIIPLSCVHSMLLTIFRRYCSKDSTVASGSIFSILPVRSIKDVSPEARSKRNLKRLVSI